MLQMLNSEISWKSAWKGTVKTKHMQKTNKQTKKEHKYIQDLHQYEGEILAEHIS